MNKSLLLKLNIRLKNRFNLFKTIESRKGFTLVELIVVLTLIAILFSISIFSITGWLDWSKFQHENAAAEDIFYAAQNQLTELDSSGAINRVVKESLADSAHPEKYHSDYILADSNNNSLAGFYNSDGDEYSWDSIWKDNNKAKVERTIITLRAPAHSYDNYVGNRNSVDPDVRLLFDLMYEVYRNKLYLGETNITDADLNIFFKDKQDQNEKVAAITDTSVKKLKQVYCKYMFEAGLLTGKTTEKKIVKTYIDPDLRFALQNNAMEKYLSVLTGER